MSVSKLESLPNEILIDLLENYLDSVDILVAFVDGLNARFTSLVYQCQIFHLNLTNIRKENFDSCMRNTKIFRKKIQSLVISDRLPGQVNFFLTYFPTFNRFECLTTLNFIFIELSKNISDFSTALMSLQTMRIDSLSIKIIRSDGDCHLRDVYTEIFQLRTLRRLVLDVDDLSDLGYSFTRLRCHLQYLTIRGVGLNLIHLCQLLTYTNQLRYLNVELNNPSWEYGLSPHIYWNSEPLTELHTFIVNLHHPKGRSSIQMLTMFLSKMPNLHRLTVNDTNLKYFNSDIWNVLPGLLSSLTHFTWRICKVSLNEFRFEQMFESTQTLMSINHKFNIYRTSSNHRNDIEQIFYHYPILHNNNPDKLFWSLPFREYDHQTFSLTLITTVHITRLFPLSMMEYKLNHVKFLRFDWMDWSVFTWIKTFIHLHTIIKLDVSSIKENSPILFLLISHLNYLQSLSIDFNILIVNSSMQTNQSIKRLDISVIEHPFTEQYIHLLANLFPSIEHLAIYTKDLHHVPLLQKYLPNLITVTFRISDPDYRHERNRPKWIRRFRTKVTFEYQLIEDSITVWIDEDVFNDSFWRATSKSQRFCLSRAIRHVTKKLTNS